MFIERQMHVEGITAAQIALLFVLGITLCVCTIGGMICIVC